MVKGPAAMRKTIIDTAYTHACAEGLAALSIRNIAKECNIAVGTIYNYFPDKAALVIEVITKFWRTIAFSEETKSCLDYRQGENLLVFCERLYTTMQQALHQFKINWLGEVSSLDARTRQKCRQAENACFEHIYQSLEKVIYADNSIKQERITSIGTNKLARLIWQDIHHSLRMGDDSYKTLFGLLKLALY